MPSVKEWATSFKSSRRSSLDPSRTSQVSLSNMDVNDSERTLVNTHTLEVQDLQTCTSEQSQDRRSSASSSSDQPSQAKDTRSIERRVDYCVVEDDRYAVRFGNYTGVWAGDAADSVPQTRSRYFGDHIHQQAYGNKP
ncbi:hypothetical protein VFPPC_14139 [Pochonia chlamydosporia 170]|uniref:Uncharacterized protein n=1 Tax=Pochonia chlamydosporia 170 TaxID=1380566 RepID=A0A179FAQ9_METCM|nr:hypothetical protein VFPPC_14139 [Pochonia chlamydosporia 170]OAQ62390.1 hypothetical protein VFPPC_14139 [Pochonia chlamydosporia 170]